MKSGIYEIKNKHNGHRYIGSSLNIDRRWHDHKHLLTCGNHHSSYLQNAWNKYGEDAFEFSIIELCFPWVLTSREQYFFKTYHPEYNVSKDTLRPMMGLKHSDETRDKISKSLIGRVKWNIGRIASDETRQKISDKLKGNSNSKGSTKSQEARKKISEARKGKPLSEEHKKKLSEAISGRIPWNKGKSKDV